MAASTAGSVARFMGPAGATAETSSWDSAVLELRDQREFVLELWSFSEAWRVPPVNTSNESPPPDGNPSPSINPDRPRASFRVLDEARVSYRGIYDRCEAQAVQLSGFSRGALNQTFVANERLLIGGLPTWWAADGQHFLYYAQEHAHWKANSVRTSGGDGTRAVELGRRRAGRGYAHSGPNQDTCSPAEALVNTEGWFEAVDDEWKPVSVQGSYRKAWLLQFRADDVAVETRCIRGDDSNSNSQKLGSTVFSGWSQQGSTALHLLLPSTLDIEEGSQLVQAQLDEAPEILRDVAGDPEILILHTSSKL